MQDRAVNILKKLINDHPDSYVKIGDKYIPTLIELFDLDFIRRKKKIIDSGTFKPETYQNLPVIFTCDVNEEYAFNYLYNQLIYKSYNVSISDKKIDSYISLMARLTNTNEFKDFLSNINKSSYVYLILSEYQLEIKNLFDVYERCKACKLIYDYLTKNINIKYTDNIIINKCKYGRYCRYRFNCKYLHPELDNISFSNGLACLDNSLMDKMRNILKFYGFIYITSLTDYNILLDSIGRKNYIPDNIEDNFEDKLKIYRPLTKKIHNIISTKDITIPLMIEYEGIYYNYESERIKDIEKYGDSSRKTIKSWKLKIDNEIEEVYLIIV